MPATLPQILHHHWRGRVIVVTGGSAGVGRATARLAAELGAHVGLIARNDHALEALCVELRAYGGRVAWAQADVADAEALEMAAQSLEDTLGPVDVWVNNAMATVFSPAEDLTPEELQRVTEVTYLGSAYGMLTGVRHMRRRDRGVIVQVGSALAYRGIPLQAAYSAAKHALRGFSDALRSELRARRSGIAMTMVHLPAIDTPQFDWARTHQRKAPRPVAPVYTAELAARAILQAAARPVREYWLGGNTLLVAMGQALAPVWLDKYLARVALSGQERDELVSADRPDNLFEPPEGPYRVTGAFGHEARNRALLLSGPAPGWGQVLIGIGLGAALMGILRKRGPVERRS